MKKFAITMLLAGSTLLMADGAAAYAKCVGCHGANGEKAALGKSKNVAEMTHADIATALKGYKTGTYGGPMKSLMKGQVASMSDADIQAVADHIAAMK